MIATSAGAPTLSVPRSSNEGKQRAALTVAAAMIAPSGMPNMMNFDITLGRSTTPRVFDVVFQSTVFSSVLSAPVREVIAREMTRVLKPNGVVLWYDFAFDNPKNKNVAGMKRDEVARLFPGAALDVRRVTLAPPLARQLVPRSWLVATLLERVRLLNTHLLIAIRP